MKNKLSLQDRILTLLSGIPPTPQISNIDKYQDPRGITIRFKPEVRNFLDHQAKHIGCSIQELVSITMTSVMHATDNPEKSEIEIICSRFRHIFAAHDLNIFDIPEIIQSGEIKKSDLIDDEKLIDSLSKEVIEETAKIFNIDYQWLNGSSKRTFIGDGQYSWYKSIGSVAFKIAKYILNSENIEVIFIANSDKNNFRKNLDNAYKFGDAAEERLEMGVVIKRTKNIKKNLIKTYDVLNYERWNYEKCRANLQMLMLFCEKTRIKYSGNLLNRYEFYQLFSGEKLAAEIMNRTNDNWTPDILTWHCKERNPGYRDLIILEDTYKEHKNSQKDYFETGAGNIKLHEKAIKEPFSLIDREAYIKGDFKQESHEN